MRIVIIGQAAFGKSVLQRLTDAESCEVIAVFCPPDTTGREDELKLASESKGIRIEQFKRMRGTDAVETFLSLTPDLCVMAYVTDIVPKIVMEAPKFGTIQYHPSLLPKHRGPSSMNWPIIQGEKRTGITIFWPDSGLDTGHILLQRETAIEPQDTLGSLYFNKLFPMGVEAIADAVRLIQLGNAPKLPQDNSEATYEGWCRAKDAVINWNEGGLKVFNLIRGCDPQPGANTALMESRISLFDCALENYGSLSTDEPGTVVQIDDQSLWIAARNATIKVGRVKPPNKQKLPAGPWAKRMGLKVGFRFED